MRFFVGVTWLEDQSLDKISCVCAALLAQMVKRPARCAQSCEFEPLKCLLRHHLARVEVQNFDKHRKFLWAVRPCTPLPVFMVNNQNSIQRQCYTVRQNYSLEQILISGNLGMVGQKLQDRFIRVWCEQNAKMWPLNAKEGLVKPCQRTLPKYSGIWAFFIREHVKV